ncbi:hypothetical protein I317_01546 [Kwoniella heveanensis CBS 569]|nr:hypothetical protein I317_01546 [Kwoniella heveanensis CBS 569]
MTRYISSQGAQREEGQGCEWVGVTATSLTTPDLLSPYILRSLSNLKIVKLITGPSANYAVVLDIHGAAYIFGRPPSPALATSSDIISENAPVKISPTSLGLKEGVKFVDGAAGRGHVFLIDSEGGVWGCGNNVTAQIGLPVTMLIPKFTKVTGPWLKDPEAKIIQVTAGHTFSLFLTSTGQVYAAGSSENGQLGNGKTGERLVKAGKVTFDLEVPPRLVQGFTDKKIVQIASGNQHSLALDEEGFVYAWGYAGYSRLGLQDQVNRLVPTIVPHFAGNNVATRGHAILCGPTSSIVIDRQKMFLIAGKFKLTGDGSTGQAYTYFNLSVMACKVIKASCGGCTHFLTTPDPVGGIMTVGFGQGAVTDHLLELGLGPDAGKSATKAQKIEPLSGIDVIDVAGGAFFSLFLAKPNEALEDLTRFPEWVPSDSNCMVCGDDDSAGVQLECEKCEQPYHLFCLDPPLKDVPEGQWFCPECAQEADGGVDHPFLPLSLDEPRPKNRLQSALERVQASGRGTPGPAAPGSAAANSNSRKGSRTPSVKPDSQSRAGSVTSGTPRGTKRDREGSSAVVAIAEPEVKLGLALISAAPR